MYAILDGWFTFLIAFASICLTLSLVTENIFPIDSRVFSFWSLKPFLAVKTFSSLGVNEEKTLLRLSSILNFFIGCVFLEWIWELRFIKNELNFFSYSKKKIYNLLLNWKRWLDYDFFRLLWTQFETFVYFYQILITLKLKQR